MAGFRIKVGGDIVDIKKSLTELKTDLKGFKKDLESATDPKTVVRLNASIKETEAAMKRIRSIGAPIDGEISKGANQAATSVTNFSRVIQDAPFGILGVANNIDPLVESFRRLRAETGSAKAAFSALGSSLLGGAGLGLAVSVATSLLIVFQDKLFSTSKAADELKKKHDDLIDSLKSTALVTAEAAAAEEGNIAKVRALASVIVDQTKSYEERNRALGQLKDVNKAYFGDLTLEETKLQAVTDAVFQYTQAIKAQAVVKGFTDEIGKTSVELAKEELALNRSRDALQRLKAERDQTKQFTTSATGEERLSGAYVKINKQVQQAQKEFEEQRRVVEALGTNYAELSGQIDAAVQETLKFKDTSTKAAEKEEDLLKKRLDALEKIKAKTKDINTLVQLQESIFDLQVRIAVRDQAQNQLSATELQDQIRGFKNELQDAFNRQAIELEAIPKVRFSAVVRAEIPPDIDSLVAKAVGLDKKIPVITLHQVRIRLLGEKTTALIEGQEKLNEELNRAVQEAIGSIKVEALAGIGDLLGNLLSGDFSEGFRKQAKQMLGVIGSTIQQLGKFVITTALKLQALKKILEKFAITNPALAVAAGIGLVALGGVLKNISFTGPKLAQGGIVSSPTVAMVGEAGREAIIPLNKLPQIMRQAQGGGGGNISIGLGIRGRELVPFIERETRAFNRIN